MNNEITEKFKKHLADTTIHEKDAKINDFCKECGVIYQDRDIDYKEYLNQMINIYKEIPVVEVLDTLFEINNSYKNNIDDTFIINVINYIDYYYEKSRRDFINKHINIFNEKNIKKIKDKKTIEYIILNNPNVFSIEVINIYLKEHKQFCFYHILKLPMEKIKQLKVKATVYNEKTVLINSETINDPEFFDKLYELEEIIKYKISIENEFEFKQHLINKIIKEFRLKYVYDEMKGSISTLWGDIAAKNNIKTKKEFIEFLKANTINDKDKNIDEYEIKYITLDVLFDEDFKHLIA